MLHERRELENALKAFEIREYDAVFSTEYFPEQRVKGMIEDWIAKVKQETGFLLPSENLGVTVFVAKVCEEIGGFTFVEVAPAFAEKIANLARLRVDKEK